MIFYILLALVVFLLSFYNNKWIFFFILLLFFFINIFRDYSVGTDYGRNYKRNYDSSITYDLNSNLKLDLSETSDVLTTQNEIAWRFITFVSKKMDLPFSFVNFIAASLIFTFLFLALRRSPLPVFSLLLYLLLFRYFASFNILRQSVSITILLYAIKYVEERNMLKYFLYCIFASLFHASSLILIFVYFLPFLKINKKTSYLLIFISFLVPILQIDKLLLGIFYDFNLINSYVKYLDIGYEFKRLMIVYYIPNIILSFIFIYLHYKSETKELNIYSKLWFLSLLITNLTINYYALFRINEFFITSLIIGIPLLVKNKNVRVTHNNMIFVFIFLMIYFFEYLLGNLNSIVPYKFIFS